LNKYKIIKKLGEGAFGVVYECEVIGTNTKVAIKVIDLQMAAKNNMTFNEIKGEVDVLMEIDSPYVMKCTESERVENKFYIVCEYVKGKELISLLEEDGRMSEKLAKEIFQKILIGVSHMHMNKFIHRDLKLENIFVKFNNNSKEIDEIKIVDLGFGKKIWSQTTGFMGTPNYMPPEVFNNLPYDFKFDSFSLGVILYTMFVCDFPFNGSSVDQLSKEIKKKEVDFKREEFKNVSKEAKDLITKLLEKNKDKRVSVQEALDHEWFKTKDFQEGHVDLDEQQKSKILKAFNE